jgi:hypothetical protein
LASEKKTGISSFIEGREAREEEGGKERKGPDEPVQTVAGCTNAPIRGEENGKGQISWS